MADKKVTEWAFDGVLEELASIHRSMKDRQFAFILGAGASFTSGIPTGQILAQRWLKDLHLRECVNGLTLEEWISSCGIGDGKLNLGNAADYYPQIFERRFEGDREAGYAELEAAMEGKSPSLGYSLLAEIIQHTRHKVVITTNFDNLVADALAMHAHQSPLVVAHESLAGFVRPQLRRPLVAKIHRDLFLNPINDEAGVSKMEQGWKIALKKLFQYFTPVVVGYGGNDGSLMNMLDDLRDGDIAGRMIWCYRDDSPPPTKVKTVLSKHNGILVKIAGFDEFMLQLAAKLVEGFDVGAIAERTAQLGQQRANLYRDQAERLRISSAQGTPAERKAGEVLSESVRTGRSWWAWQLKAEAAPDNEAKQRVYEDGIQQFPRSAELLTNYSIFLASIHKDYDKAEVYFKRAIDLEPSNSKYISNYAFFLKSHRNDLDGAEEMYKRALDIDPSDASTIGKYANFLSEQRKNLDAAEAMYKKALELAPNNATNIGNYATFLADQRNDPDSAEAMYIKALEIEPDNAITTANYAIFLKNQRKDFNTAEKMYEKAIELDPKNATTAGNYAFFLSDKLKKYDEADIFFKKAIEIDPKDSRNTGNYATFLADHRKKYKEAEFLYKKALEANPSDANHMVNYASLLIIFGDKKNLEQAKSLLHRARSLLNSTVTQPLVESFLYHALIQDLQASPEANDTLARLKGAIQSGYKRGIWDFSPMFEKVLPRLPAPQQEFYKALGRAILDAECIPMLDAFEQWTKLKAADPLSK